MKTFQSEDEVKAFMAKAGGKLVIYQGVVYEVGEYMEQHPGGQALIEDELGTNIDDKFEEAEHTKSAKNIFKDLEVVGKMKNHEETSADSGDDTVPGSPAHMSGDKLGCRRDFDYSTGLWEQIWRCDWDFEEYYTYINEPKVLINPSRPLILFKHPLRETITRTPWWLIPLFWTPVVAYLFLQVSDAYSLHFKLFIYTLGILTWTLAEYMLHRFFFHCEELGLFPKHSKVYAIHFLVHGIHHAFPQDIYRLVFPPILGVPIFVFMFYLPYVNVLGWDLAHNLLSGMMTGYIGYDMIHYLLHHYLPQEGYWHNLRVFHMQHHYKFPQLGFGVSSKLWDLVFGTDIPIDTAKKQAS